jgi:hypothetical protein
VGSGRKSLPGGGNTVIFYFFFLQALKCGIWQKILGQEMATLCFFISFFFTGAQMWEAAQFMAVRLDHMYPGPDNGK